MLALNEKQFMTLHDEHRAGFPSRIRSHWEAAHPGLVAQFTEPELTYIVSKVIDLGLAQPGHTEASIALGADLWLAELAQRKRGQP
jgi:hypothetical protein